MKNKYHIGLNLGHNSSIAIVDNNQKLIFATDIDRYTKISYDHGYYEDQIERAMHYLKIKKKMFCLSTLIKYGLEMKKLAILLKENYFLKQ